MANLYAFAGQGQSKRFQPFKQSEFTNEFKKMGWNHVSNFKLQDAGRGWYVFGGRVNSTNSIDFARGALIAYFDDYFSNVTLNVQYTSLSPVINPINVPVTSGNTNNTQQAIITANDVPAIIDNANTQPPSSELNGFEKFALSLGVGVPVLIVGGALVFITIFKPRN